MHHLELFETCDVPLPDDHRQLELLLDALNALDASLDRFLAEQESAAADAPLRNAEEAVTALN
jgi:hypothetical protein